MIFVSVIFSPQVVSPGCSDSEDNASPEASTSPSLPVAERKIEDVSSSSATGPSPCDSELSSTSSVIAQPPAADNSSSSGSLSDMNDRFKSDLHEAASSSDEIAQPPTDNPSAPAPAPVMQSDVEATPCFDVGSMKVLKPLGRGAFGEVSFVQEEGSGNCYALKVQDAFYKEDHEVTMNEVQMLERVRKLGSVVELVGAAYHSDKNYLLFELGVGGSLYSKVAKGHLEGIGIGQGYRLLPGLHMRDVKSNALCIIKAIRDMHNLGIVHRDVKLDNMILMADG